MVQRSRAALFAVLLVASTALAGCNLKDWYNQRGTVRVMLAPIGPDGTDLLDFQQITVAIYGVSVKQYLIIDSKEFTFGDQPKLFDMVEAGTKGTAIPLLETTLNIRAIESVQLRLDVLDAVDARGASLPICRENEPAESFPCFFVPKDGVYYHEGAQFSTPRGGSVTFHYPIGVKAITQGGQLEYFLYEDPSKVVIETAR